MVLVFIGNHSNIAIFIVIIKLSIAVIKFDVDCVSQPTFFLILTTVQIRPCDYAIHLPSRGFQLTQNARLYPTLIFGQLWLTAFPQPHLDINPAF